MVFLLGFVLIFVHIPLYACACVISDSAAPCRLNLSGTERSIISSFGLFAPSFAKRSACSLPWWPLCPLTHINDVCADLFLRWYVVAFRYSLFSTFIQPLFSQSGKFFVSPSIAYLESVTIVIGMYGAVCCSAMSIAAISASWFDCLLPGILMARLSR